SQASPTVDLSLDSDNRMLSDLSSSSEASVSVPSVTMRVTWRSTGPFAVAGSPICSQIATDSPSFTSLARYCSTECTGTPAIFTGAPADWPRAVSVRSDRKSTRLNSSHDQISYAVFCLKKKKNKEKKRRNTETPKT